jgi:hypothetical protein
METMPSAAELLEAVAGCLRDELLPVLSGRAAFQARVAANVLAIAQRELVGAPRADAAEAARLRGLLAGLGGPGAVAGRDEHDAHDEHEGHDAHDARDARDAHDAHDRRDGRDGRDGREAQDEHDGRPADPLPRLRRALCDAIRDGRAGLDTPGLADHLWAEVLARVAIEQPGHPGFVREAGPGRPDPARG